MSAGFVHLHNHTEYSVLDGACRIHEMLERCKEYGMDACAITDHGALFGVVDFYLACKKAKIRPIIGCELYVARGKREDRSARNASSSYDHLLVLCENEAGYHNLCRLSSIGYLEGHHYKPRVDLEVLARYHEGLLASSACLGGEIPRHLLSDDFDAANAAAERYIEIFGRDRFFIEIMDHGMPEERQVNPKLVKIAERHGLRLIATNDSHYLDKSDAKAHDALLCIQTNALIDDTDRFRFPSEEFYFRSAEEMRELFSAYPEAISNTVEVARMCNVELPLDRRLIPEYVPPDGIPKADYLRKLVYLGLEDRYHGSPSREHVARADYELDMVEQMGFVDYFLVVWDFMAHARRSGIPVGPGRGSAAGSLAAYALGITNIDPIRYGLLFERFLNPDRVDMPDIDLDFCMNRREEVLEYIRKKYGANNVSQIITFGRMLARQVIRNVGRVLGMPYGDVDRIAKLIPEELKITLEDTLTRVPELKELVAQDAQVGRLLSLARRLEGIIGNCGTHAAGVIVCDQPLTDHVALFKAPSSEVVASQIEMKGIGKVGLLKMDLLGLRTLTVIHDAVRFVRENRGKAINIDDLEPNDKKTYDLLRSGKTTGVFQLESSGMRDLAKRIGLESLEEVCALVALYRPGPMQLKDQYIESKHNPKKIVYDHPLIEPILKETYGVALYQEQVMQIVQAVAGFSLGQADILRRAMGKKIAELMGQQRSLFVEGAAKKNIDEKTADVLFKKIEQFAGYGFNKSHSMAYAFVAYQTAYLKANYPVEFMTALLTSETGNLDKIAEYVEECRNMNIDVLPPDVNKSVGSFSVEGNAIRFGMTAVKNAGSAPAEAIVAERDAGGAFKDIFDFCRRVDSRYVNRRLIESLNKAGAFLSTGWSRSQVDKALDEALSEGQISQRDRDSGQTSLLDLFATGENQAAYQRKPDIPEWPESTILASEREMLGLYVSSHPLAKHAETIRRFSTVRASNISDLRDGQNVVIGGMVNTVKRHTTARNKAMAFLGVDTLDGSCEVTVFSDVFEKRAGLLVQDMVVMIPARVSFRNGQAGLLADDILPIDDAEERLARAVHIRLNTVGLEDALLHRIIDVLSTKPGRCDVFLHCPAPNGNGETTIQATSACRVAVSPELKREIEEILGEETVWYSGGNGAGA